MRIFVTGADGQLGKAVCKLCSCTDQIYFPGHCDVTNRNEVYNEIEESKPDMVIHCAAYTAVDKAETEPEICNKINVMGTQNVACACKEFHAQMAYLSTDYVFGGHGDTPYEVDSPINPLNVYGKSKADGEAIVREVLKEHYIVRTSWMFGEGQNFVKTMLRLAEANTVIRVVNDQIGSPTYSEDLAIALLDLVRTRHYGTYHMTNEGYCSWADLAREVFRLKNMPVYVQNIFSEEYQALACRPKNSRLSMAKLDLIAVSRLPCWQEALSRYLQ